MNITNEVINEYINTFFRNDDDRLVKLREQSEIDHIKIILRDTENFLRVLMTLKKPTRILEVGTAVGYSSSCFAEWTGARVTTIENNPEVAEKARENIKSLNLDHLIDVIVGDGRDVLRELCENPPQTEEDKYDIVFIDAAKSHYKLFWDLSMQLVNDDALIICDNVLQKGMTASDQFDTRSRYKTSIRHMRNFLDFIHEVDYADTAIVPIGDGVSVSLLKR